MTAAARSSHADPMILTQSEATAAQRTILFHLVVAADGTDAVGLVPVVTIAKAGAAFGAGGGVATELANGWYKYVAAVGDLDTIGALAMRVAVATADTIDVVHQVTAFDLNAAADSTISAGTAQAGAVGSITLAAAEPAVDNALAGVVCRIVSGTGAKQTRLITAYNGTTKVATPDRNFTTAPDNTSVYVLIAANPVGVDPVVIKDSSLTAAKFSADALAAMAGKLTAKPNVLVGTLTGVATSFARSMRQAYDSTITLAGTWNGATVKVETTQDETAVAPVWTDRSAGGLTADGSVTLTGPYSAWRARTSAGAVTSVTVKAADRIPQSVQ